MTCDIYSTGKCLKTYVCQIIGIIFQCHYLQWWTSQTQLCWRYHSLPLRQRYGLLTSYKLEKMSEMMPGVVCKTVHLMTPETNFTHYIWADNANLAKNVCCCYIWNNDAIMLQLCIGAVLATANLSFDWIMRIEIREWKIFTKFE